jgi:hypothetical protein
MLAYNNTGEIKRADPSIFQVQTQNAVTESDEIDYGMHEHQGARTLMSQRRLSTNSSLVLIMSPVGNKHPVQHFLDSFVEVKVCIRLLNIGSVTLLEVLGEDNIPIFSDSMHTSFLANCRDLKTNATKSVIKGGRERVPNLQ